MTINLKITKKNPKPFVGDDGEEREYFWYNGERTADGVSIQFGSVRGDYEVGQTYQVELLKRESNRAGQFRYTEIV